MKPSTKLQMIAADDIGAFAALAFSRPEEYIGAAIELAGDELGYAEIARAMTRVLGKTVRYTQQPMEQVRSYNSEVADMFEWFEQDGYKADIPALRQRHSTLQQFETWLQNEQYTVKENE